MRAFFSGFLMLAACSGSDTGLVDSGLVSVASPFSGYYQLVEMSGQLDDGSAISVRYEPEMVDMGLGEVPRMARGYLSFDESTQQMDIRMTVLTNGIPSGIIQGSGEFTEENDGQTLVLRDGISWVYQVESEGERLILSNDLSDERNGSKQSILTRYVFERTPLPENPLIGAWQVVSRETTSSVQGPECSLDQDMFIAKLYGTAAGQFTIAETGGLEVQLNLAMWQDDATCSGDPIFDLKMTGVGLCEVFASESKLSCSYNRVDGGGNRIQVHWDGRYTLEGDALSVAISGFKADSTDPELTAMTFSRVVSPE